LPAAFEQVAHAPAAAPPGARPQSRKRSMPTAYVTAATKVWQKRTCNTSLPPKAPTSSGCLSVFDMEMAEDGIACPQDEMSCAVLRQTGKSIVLCE